MEKNRASSFRLRPFILLAALALFICFGLDMTHETLKSWQYLMVLISVLLTILVFRKYLPIDDISMIIAIGIFLKLAYVLYTAVWTRQHDVVDFNTGEGHAGYIEYLIQNEALPNFDPRSVWAFFQPPLHHILSAIWMKVSIYAGQVYRQSQENVQALTLCYTSAVAILSYFTCKELELKKWGMRVALLIISFHPVYVILSGSINNDALSLVLSMLAFYLAVVWYKRPSFPVLMLIAGSVGLSMMAKLTGGLVAVPIAVLFCLKVFGDKKSIGANLKKYIPQFIPFAVIVFPLGLWWSIRNMILFDMPFNYIPPVGEQLAHAGLVSRLFDIRMHSVYPAMIAYGDAYDEYNVPLALIKTSLFGEYNLATEWTAITPFAVILFISGLVLAIAAFAAMLYMLFSKKSGLKKEWKLSFGALYAALLAAYGMFAFGSNNFSAQDFRYIALIIVVEAIFLGLFVDQLNIAEKKQKLCGSIVIGATAVFAVSSFIVYMMLGFAR